MIATEKKKKEETCVRARPCGPEVLLHLSLLIEEMSWCSLSVAVVDDSDEPAMKSWKTIHLSADSKSEDRRWTETMINLILFMVYLLKLPCILRHDSRTPIWVFLKYLRKVMRSPAGFPIYTLAQPRALLGTSHVQIIRSIQHPIDIQPSIGYYLLSRGLNLSKLSSLNPSTFPLCT